MLAAFFCAFSVFACRPHGGGAPDGGVSDASDGVPGPWQPPLGPGPSPSSEPTPEQTRLGAFVVASPAVLVNSTSLGAWTATTNGLNVAAGETVSVKLADSAGARLWQLAVVGTDERVAAPTITQAVSVSGTATFVAPAAGTPPGWALVLRSQIGYTALGNDSTGRTNTAYSTTFGVYTPTTNSYRVGAVNETVEGSSAYGWAAKLNPLLRAEIATGSGVGTDRAVNSTGLIQGGGNLSTDRTLSLLPGTNNYVIQTIAGVPTWQLIGNANIATGAAIDLGKISQGSATTGQAIVWNGSTWVAGTATSASCGVVTLAALRAVTAANRVDGQQCSVITPTGAWVYSNTSGAGFADDGATVLLPNDLLVGANGRWYNASGPVLPTIAALRFAVAGKHPAIHVQAYSSLGDGGGGDFEYDSTDTTSTDNTGTNVVAGTRRYKRRYSGALHGEWWGVKANALQITDGVRTSANARIVSASGLFTASMVGRAVLLRERDNTSVGAGTITIPGGGSYNANGTGTNFAVAFPKIANEVLTVYQPASGGAMWVNGSYYAVNYVDPTASPNQLLVLFDPTPTQTGQAFYTEVQRITTVAAYVSPTEVTLGITAPVTESGVWATIATDDTTAIDTAVDTALALGAHELVMPTGLSGISSNLGFTNASDLTIRWERGGGLVDLRKISSETAYPNATSYYGALSFVTSNNIHLVGGTYDANVPVLGVVHSAGGSVNNSGSRSGVVMSSCVDCSVEDFSSTGYGARDEHIYVQGASPNMLIEKCHVVGNNNVSLNINGNGTGDGDVRIHENWATGILLGTASFVVDSNNVTTNGHARLSGGITASNVGHGVISNNQLHDMNWLNTGSSAIDIFGGNNADSSLTIAHNKIFKNNGLWDATHGAPIKVNNHGGTVTIDDNVIDKNTAYPSAGRFINILGSSTGKVHITGTNVLRGRAGSLMTIGIEVESGVPAGAVTIDDGIVYGESITTRHVLGNTGGRGNLSDAVTISATGTTALTVSTDTAVVTANGTVTATLADPTKIAGKRVVVKNSTTQAGTTTVGTAAGNIDGSATFAMAGANQAAEFLSDGTNWKLLTGSSSLGGGVPTTRTLAGTSPVRIDGGASADLSANRTISLLPLVNADISSSAAVAVSKLASGTNGDVISTVAGVPTWTSISGGGGVPSTRTVTGSGAIKIAGDNAAHDLSADRTWSVADAAAATKGVIELDTDFGGTAAAPNVVQLTGVGGVVNVPAATQLRWDSGTGPAIQDIGNDLALQVNQNNGSIKLYNQATLWGYWNYNSGNAYFQQSSGAGFQLISSGGALRLQSATGSTPITFVPGGSTVKGTWTSTDLTFDMPLVQFGANVSLPKISQAAASASASTMTIEAQSAGGSNNNGADLLIKSGTKTGSGTDGSIFWYAGPTITGRTNAIGTRFGDGTAPTFVGLEVAAGQVLIGSTAATFGRFAAAAATAGSTTIFSGQDGTGSGDRDGGPVFVSGGLAANSGVPGRVSLVTDGSKEIVQAVTITNELRHVVGLARASSLTNTQMPSNSGDYVVYIGNTTSAPAANPVSGGILYVEAGALKFRGSSGTVTTVANPFWRASVEGMPANDNGIECETWQRECAGWR